MQDHEMTFEQSKQWIDENIHKELLKLLNNNAPINTDGGWNLLTEAFKKQHMKNIAAQIG